jgi:pilus assembly protein CpaC
LQREKTPEQQGTVADRSSEPRVRTTPEQVRPEKPVLTPKKSNVAPMPTLTAQSESAGFGSTANMLAVPVGQTMLMHFPKIKRVTVGDGTVLDVKVFQDTDEVLLLGKADGLTDLRLWDRDGVSNSYLVKVQAIKPAPVEIPLQAEQTILIKARLVEIKRSTLRDIGIDWSDVAAGPQFGTLNDLVTNRFFRTVPTGVNFTPGGGGGGGSGLLNLPANVGTGNNYLGFTTIVDSMLKFLVNNGDARMLAEPTLTCINGGQADFLAGGELPIPIVDNDGRVNVQFKEFGIILNIEPQANEQGLIRTKVKVEVSSVDQSISVLGIPGFATRKTNTEMNVQSGETMVIGGLVSSDDAKTVVKVPGLGNIPIIGELFKSRQFRNGQTELVVLVTPSVVTTASESVKTAIKRSDELQEKANTDLKFKLLD